MQERILITMFVSIYNDHLVRASVAEVREVDSESIISTLYSLYELMQHKFQ